MKIRASPQMVAVYGAWASLCNTIAQCYWLLSH